MGKYRRGYPNDVGINEFFDWLLSVCVYNLTLRDIKHVGI